MSARLRFEPAGVDVEAAVGERVLDAADDHPELGLPLACRAGNCGACLVAVRAGSQLFEPPGTAERETLSALGAPAGRRLACQLMVAASGSAVLSLGGPKAR